jgi:transposase-like protein
MKAHIDLPNEHRQILEKFVRRRNSPHWLVIRSQILLLLAKGTSIREIARRLEISRNTVRTWLRRWKEQSPKLSVVSPEPTEEIPLEVKIKDLLTDQLRSGRPVTFAAEQVVAIIAVSLQSPSEFDRPVSHWTPGELADEVIKQEIVQTISPRSVGRFLKSG